ncbi:hypothetical protein DPMN_098471 [Dreissena polymorpha]|uniref:Uncharacterized protein n=1 Tax=Dreissena polymorpha TaxID=45954 RepID=A0A9D4LFA3_DREPO|nr:hypothetical protein DPMN_098471 [Dreissena polymorpha]
MAEKTMKMGTRVEVIGKGVVGTVAYMGTTMFSAGMGNVCNSGLHGHHHVLCWYGECL